MPPTTNQRLGGGGLDRSAYDDDFTKTYIKPDGTGHRKNHLPYGVCTLTKRRSADAHIMTMMWIEFLQEQFGN